MTEAPAGSADPTVVHVVDDDRAVRNALGRMLKAAGLAAVLHGSAEEFLAAADPSAVGCLVLDVRLPAISGLELQKRLSDAGATMPIIMISAAADVPCAVEAMRQGAIDFLRKPYEPRVLLERVRAALARAAAWRAAAQARSAALSALGRLTPRERQVFEGLARGQAVKQIALQLGLSRKTVDIHRGHVMLKLDAHSVADLVHLWLAAQGDAAAGAPPAAKLS